MDNSRCLILVVTSVSLVLACGNTGSTQTSVVTVYEDGGRYYMDGGILVQTFYEDGGVYYEDGGIVIQTIYEDGGYTQWDAGYYGCTPSRNISDCPLIDISSPTSFQNTGIIYLDGGDGCGDQVSCGINIAQKCEFDGGIYYFEDDGGYQVEWPNPCFYQNTECGARVGTTFYCCVRSGVLLPPLGNSSWCCSYSTIGWPSVCT